MCTPPVHTTTFPVSLHRFSASLRHRNSSLWPVRLITDEVTLIVPSPLNEGRANVKVLETQDRWFGVTYQEDKEAVQEAFAGLIKEGVYPANLWG